MMTAIKKQLLYVSNLRQVWKLITQADAARETSFYQPPNTTVFEQVSSLLARHAWSGRGFDFMIKQGQKKKGFLSLSQHFGSKLSG